MTSSSGASLLVYGPEDPSVLHHQSMHITSTLLQTLEAIQSKAAVCINLERDKIELKADLVAKTLWRSLILEETGFLLRMKGAHFRNSLLVT
ncbi:hypothetical protein AAHA92_22278 [Salvia divinorum]|uniref:Uncharacterized protein n=1 Tax=Salvia divinorum TaxID=28513 RepID=A0ABD1GPB5_SALDI